VETSFELPVSIIRRGNPVRGGAPDGELTPGGSRITLKKGEIRWIFPTFVQRKKARTNED
jgi:hypothetical protein